MSSTGQGGRRDCRRWVAGPSGKPTRSGSRPAPPTVPPGAAPSGALRRLPLRRHRRRRSSVGSWRSGYGARPYRPSGLPAEPARPARGRRGSRGRCRDGTRPARVASRGVGPGPRTGPASAAAGPARASRRAGAPRQCHPPGPARRRARRPVVGHEDELPALRRARHRRRHPHGGAVDDPVHDERLHRHRGRASRSSRRRPTRSRSRTTSASAGSCRSRSSSASSTSSS